jgi:hypothetical protein
MTAEVESDYVAECFLPGARQGDLSALDERTARWAARLARSGRTIRYLGSLLFHEDEVVLCLFAGEVAAIREAAQAAEIPFSRIVSSTRSPQALAIGGER